MPTIHLPEEAEHRTRLLEAIGRAVATHGYADTTIAHIVREAGVSRRTFYEHFGTKADCFIALYEAASRAGLAVLRGAIDPAHEWPAQVEHAMAAYLGYMAGNPVLLRTLFIGILGLGAEGLAARRRLNQDIARFMLDVVNARQGGRKRKAPLTPEMATAVVGGIHELVLQALEAGRVGQLKQLAGPAALLVRSVAQA
ncbi:MAG: TetR family transcriptional regulator [Ramlibacter sp.]|nr:TetR family transcriptional regulator [Ramlibacter sp.]